MAIAVGRRRRKAVQPGVRRQHPGVVAHSAEPSIRDRRLPPFAVVGGVRERSLHRRAEVLREHTVGDRVVALDNIGPWAVPVDDELHQFDGLPLYRRVEARLVGLRKARQGREVGGDQPAVAARDDAQREELRHSGFVEEAVERGALHEAADRLAQRVGAACGRGRFGRRRATAGKQHGRVAGELDPGPESGGLPSRRRAGAALLQYRHQRRELPVGLRVRVDERRSAAVAQLADRLRQHQTTGRRDEIPQDRVVLLGVAARIEDERGAAGNAACGVAGHAARGHFGPDHVGEARRCGGASGRCCGASLCCGVRRRVRGAGCHRVRSAAAGAEQCSRNTGREQRSG